MLQVSCYSSKEDRDFSAIGSESVLLLADTRGILYSELWGILDSGHATGILDKYSYYVVLLVLLLADEKGRLNSYWLHKMTSCTTFGR